MPHTAAEPFLVRRPESNGEHLWEAPAARKWGRKDSQGDCMGRAVQSPEFLNTAR